MKLESDKKIKTKSSRRKEIIYWCQLNITQIIKKKKKTKNQKPKSVLWKD